MKAIRRLLGLRTNPDPDLSVLMVCSGNICRSPTAEEVLRVKLHRAGLGDRIAVDSAGTQGLHAKEPPDPRAQSHARRRGYDLSKLRARKVAPEDFLRFHRMYAMDEGHLRWLQDKAPPDGRATLALLMSHAGPALGSHEVPDPYYGSDRDFERVLDVVEAACDALVIDLQKDLSTLRTRPGG